MSIRVEEGPQNGPALVAERLRNLRGPIESKSLARGGGRVAAPAPLPLYAIPLARLASEPAPEHFATRFGWRYIVEEGNEVSLVDLVIRSDGVLAPHAVARGAPARRLIDAALAAEAALSLQSDYEARVLDLTLVGMAALWMVGDQNSVVFELYKQGEPRELAEFLAEAKSHAMSKLAAAAASPSPEDGG